jgi:hypothetical protein
MDEIFFAQALIEWTGEGEKAIASVHVSTIERFLPSTSHLCFRAENKAA